MYKSTSHDIPWALRKVTAGATLHLESLLLLRRAGRSFHRCLLGWALARWWVNQQNLMIDGSLGSVQQAHHDLTATIWTCWIPLICPETRKKWSSLHPKHSMVVTESYQPVVSSPFVVQWALQFDPYLTVPGLYCWSNLLRKLSEEMPN
jgi:hypothetical protein